MSLPAATAFYQDGNFVAILYIVAFSLFIYGLSGLTGPRTAVRGNRIAAVGMALALIATFLIEGMGNWALIAVGLVVGTILGIPVSVNRSISFKTGTVRLNGTTFTYYPSTSTASFFGGNEQGDRFLEGKFSISASRPIDVPAK